MTLSSQYKEAVVFDLEANGLLPDVSRIHCIVLKNLKTGKLYTYTNDGTYDTIPQGIEHLREAKLIAGHNICGYDIPTLKKLYPKEMEWLDPIRNVKKLIDTFILSCIKYPDVNGHSLDAWANRLKLPYSKVKHEDWSRLTPEMMHRCNVDVEINDEVLKYISKDLAGDIHKDKRIDWIRAGHLEQQVSYIHSQQTLHGVKYNIKKAAEIYAILDTKINILEKEILAKAGRIVATPYGKIPVKPFIANGNFSKQVKTWIKKEDISNKQLTQMKIRGMFSRIVIRPINLNSRNEVINWLLSEGWKPHQFTPAPSKSPKITPILKGLGGSVVGSKYAEMKVLLHRRRSIMSDNKKTGSLVGVRSDGRVPADAMTCATPTSRYRHSGAVCNVPSANVEKSTGDLIWHPDKQKVPFGTEIRSLFCVPKGRTMIGIDLSGIEARMMAHFAFPYTGGADLADLITLPGMDFHQHNADAWGVDRSNAKNGLYALMYGCGDAKLAEQLGKKRGQGKKLRAIFWNANPALQALIKDLEIAYGKNGGYLVGLDGRMLFIREIRKLLNSLLQHAAAVVFKMWMVECYLYTEQLNPKCAQVLAYHDEIAFEFYSNNLKFAEKIGNNIIELCKQVGLDLLLNVPLNAEAKYGESWAHVH